MATRKKEKDNDALIAAEIGAGVIAAGAAAAAGYYFYGAKNAKKHRAATAKWAKSMKEDVTKEAKKLQNLDRKSAAAIVDRAASAYVGMRNVDPDQVKQAAKELKENWKELEKDVEKTQKSSRKVAKKVVGKKTAKKATKKKA